MAFANNLGRGDILVLENVRYEPGETKDDPELAAALAELGDVYVDDAFGAAHRAHASNEGVARLLPEHAAGLLLEQEVTTLTELLESPRRPLAAVLGGAKVSEKIAVIERFREVADTILIGGAMCFPFLAAQGHTVGKSLCADDDVELAKRRWRQGRGPGQPGAAGRPGRGRSAGRRRRGQTIDGVDVPDALLGADIGPRTAAAMQEIAGPERCSGTDRWERSS